MKKAILLAAGLILIEHLQSQNVGIGITNPQSTLHLRGNHILGGLSSYLTHDTVTGRIEWRNANLYVPATQALMKHSAAADGLFYNNTAPVSGQLEYRNAAGEPVFYTNFTNGNGYFKNNLGIGITSPDVPLHIVSNVDNPVKIGGGTNLYLSWYENGSARGYLGSFYGDPEDVDFGTYSGNNGKIHFTTSGTPRVTINNSGNTGIGTTDPKAKLHISNGSSGYNGPVYYTGAIIEGSFISYLNLLAPNETGVLFGNASNPAIASINYNSLFTPNGFQFRTNLQYRMVIDQVGNIGIGTVFPAARLHVATSELGGYSGPSYPGAIFQGQNEIYLMLLTPQVAAESGLLFGDPSNGHQGGVFYNTAGNPNGFQFRTFGNNNRMTINQLGNVGIGTNTPQTQLEVNGYTMLGSTAPRIQMKKLTSNTAAAQGSTVLVPHGLNSSKVISIEVLVDYGGNSFVHHSYTELPGYQFNYYINATNVGIVNVPGNSGLILSKPLRILITYEE